MIHNTLGSVVNLAKSELMALDRAALETKVVTATYVLLLNALIELGQQNKQSIEAEDRATKIVLGTIAQTQAALKERDG
jgi:hypothetical protein